MRDPDEMSAALLADFDPRLIEDKEGKRYIGHEHIRMRVIEATGNQFDWAVESTEYRDDGAIRKRTDKRTGEVHTPLTCVVRGVLTIPGLGTRTGIGVQVIEHGAGEDAPYKGAESDAFKRAAMAFGVGLRQLYMGGAGQTQQMTAHATRHDRKHDNTTNAAPADGRFGANLRKAVELMGNAETRAEGKMLYAACVQDAGTMAERWVALVEQADSPQAIDWLDAQITRCGMASLSLTAAIKRRRAEIASGAGRELF